MTSPAIAPEPVEPPRAALAVRSRERFCEYLRSQRVAADKTIEQISITTRIPERSLRFLEAGEFESLPGDVFVRGFLRSYASCLGLSPDDVVRRYSSCGLLPSPVASALADGPMAAPAADPAAEGVIVRPSIGPGGSTDVVGPGPAGQPGQGAASARLEPIPVRRIGRGTTAPATRQQRARRSARATAARRAAAARALVPSLSDGAGPRRIKLFFAVVLLAFVATVAMFVLLRRPAPPPAAESPLVATTPSSG